MKRAWVLAGVAVVVIVAGVVIQQRRSAGDPGDQFLGGVH